MTKQKIKILVIPDIQAKDGVSLEHCRWAGLYAAEKRPDIIVCIGDFADMPSLSSYDKGKKSFEGRRYKKDIKAARDAMDLFLIALYSKTVDYDPRLVLTLGNHEDRISRATELQSELDGILSLDDLPYECWEVHPFLKPVEIEGVLFCHYFANPYTGNPWGGNIDNVIKNVGQSFVAGHKQGLFMGNRYLSNGQCQWGIIAGSFYQHDEAYKTPQGNHHWRGMLMLHEVENGSFSPMTISLNYLKERYGDMNYCSDCKVDTIIYKKGKYKGRQKYQCQTCKTNWTL